LLTVIKLHNIFNDSHILALKSKGSAEDERCDGESKYAKIRPMRVEMYCIYWNRWLGKFLPRSNP